MRQARFHPEPRTSRIGVGILAALRKHTRFLSPVLWTQLAKRQNADFLARIRAVLLDRDPRRLVRRTAIVVLLFVAAVGGREALHLLMPGYTVRYVMFFPALLLAGLLCGLGPSIILLAGLSLIEFLWIEPIDLAAPLWSRVALTLSFVLAGSAIIVPAVYGVNANRRLIRRDEFLQVLNSELRHRLRNLLSVTGSICTSSLRPGCSQEEIARNIRGRMSALARAQDFLSLDSSRSSDLRDVLLAIVGPLCPNSEQLQIRGRTAAVPADMIISLSLVLHELSTNAVKYGAWRSDCAGTVEVAWHLEGGKIRLTWREHGVEISPTPVAHGFGTKLFQMKVAGYTLDHKLHPDGAECQMTMNSAN